MTLRATIREVLQEGGFHPGGPSQHCSGWIQPVGGQEQGCVARPEPDSTDEGH